MYESSPIWKLVRQVRRRALGVLIADQATIGLMASLAGSILLLVLGTQILDWYWLVVLFFAGTSIGIWRTLRRLPSDYAVAQSVDRRLTLPDTISTAFHFLNTPTLGREPIVLRQRSHAEQAAASIHASLAMPWRAPRQIYPALGLFSIVAVLFFVRYGIQGSLDLRAPMVEAVADFFTPGGTIHARAKKPPKPPGEDPLGIALDRSDGKNPDLDAAPEDVLQQVDTPDVNAPFDTRAEEKAQRSQVKAAGDQGEDLDEGSEQGERSSGDNGKEGGNDANKSGLPDPAKNAESARQGNSPESSLLNKMKDAMANLMSKLKIPNQAQSRQMASNQKSNSQSGQREPGGGQKGEKGQGQPQGKGDPSEDPDAEGQQSDQQAQAGEGRSNDKGQEGGSPNEAKSGMGKQDGDKSLKDAEQMAAMGKISEIFGKRAQNVTGEVMVEVTSGKQQQLRTAYAQRGAQHREAGSEIRRDEIPQELQHFVQQYFEQVRKGEKAGKASEIK